MLDAENEPRSRTVEAANVHAVEFDVFCSLKVERLETCVQGRRFVGDPIAAEDEAQTVGATLGTIPGARLGMDSVTQV